MKEDAEKQEDKLRFFAQVRTQHKLQNNNNKIIEFQQFYTMRSWDYVRSQDNSVDADELEAALAHMKQMQNQQPAVVPPRLKTLICATKVVPHAKKLVFQKRKKYRYKFSL